MKRRLPRLLTRERNWLAKHPLLCKGGPHGKSQKAERLAAKIKLATDLRLGKCE